MANPTREPVDWVTGACMLVNTPMILADLGGMDEDFFLYYEEVALCRSARRNGWGVIDAQRFPSKAQLCEARIARQGGIDYVTFNGASMCRMGESLHHLQINAQGSAPHR